MPRGNNPGEEASGGRRSGRIAAAAAAAAASKGKGKDKAPAEVAPKGKRGKSTAPVKRKRGRNEEGAEDEDEEEQEAQAPKKQRKAAPAAKAEVIINQIPEQELDVYVWGCGNFNELGMLDDSRDPDVPARNVKSPLKNPHLSGPHGITHVAVGARHGAALVKTPENNGNKILTWGSNEYGALGRITDERPRFATTRNDWGRYRALPDLDTKPEWKPSIVDVDVMGEELRFSQLACGAETTFALTDTGDVYGWGCFMRVRGLSTDGWGQIEKVPLELSEDYQNRLENMGVNKLVGFSENTFVQEFPIRLPELKNIKSIAAGDNHVLALDVNGKLYVWGSDEQGQLGHRRMARRDKQYLKPALFRQRNTFRLIGTGRNHSFAIQKKCRKVWGWGQNDYCQTGTENRTGVEWVPAPVAALSALSIDGKLTERITGTDIGSIASISDGTTLVWGCLEPNVTGLDPNALDPAKIIRDSDGRPVMSITPTQLERAAKSPTFVTGGRTHSILVRNGRAFSWGRNHVYECGQGHTYNIAQPTKLITAREGELRDWVWAGAGHQFGMLASHTRNTQRWERSRNELRSPASATDGQAGLPAKNASSNSVSDETRPSGESSASGRDGQVEPSIGSAEPSSVASRARSYEGSSEPIDPRIVSRNIPVPKERESPLRPMGDEESSKLELQPGSRSPRSRSPRPKVVGPVLGSRLTGTGMPRPIIEVQPVESMSSDYSERSLGPMTPSTPTPPGPQRDTEIEWGPRRADIAELDAAMPGWGPENRHYSPHEGNGLIDNVLDEPERKRAEEETPVDPPPGLRQPSAQTSSTLNRPPAAGGTQAIARRRRQSPPQSPKAPKRLPATEEPQDIVRTRRQHSRPNLVPRGRLPLAPAQLPAAEGPQETVRTRRQPSRQNLVPGERLPLAPARLPVTEGTQNAAPRKGLPLVPAPLPVAEETRDVAPRERRPLATASAPVAEDPQDIVRTQKQLSPQKHPAPKRVNFIEETQTIARTRTRKRPTVVEEQEGGRKHHSEELRGGKINEGNAEGDKDDKNKANNGGEEEEIVPSSTTTAPR